MIAFKDGRFITFDGKIICTGQTSRTGTDDGDLLCPVIFHIRWDDNTRDITGRCIQVFLSDEFLDRIDRYGLVEQASCTCVFAALVADSAADRRERIVLFDQCQSIRISSLSRQLEITLNGDVGRAGGLARSCAGVIAVDAVIITIVLIPLVFTPGHVIREFMFRIGHRAILRAKLLS